MSRMLSVSQMLVRKEITAQDLIRLRHDIFADGVRDGAEAELLFRMDAECMARPAGWTEFFVDALAEYYLFSAAPAGELTPADASHLIGHILADGRIAGETELALAIRVVERARACPVDIGFLILKAVWDSVLHPEKAAYGRDRRVGVITAEDVAIMRKAIHANGSDDGIAVSRTEAEILFALERKTDDARNDPAWRDLFVQAMAAHLLAPRNGTRDAVDGDEARWLIDQIGRDRAIRRNERALLALLHRRLGEGHPALAPLFAVAGLR